MHESSSTRRVTILNSDSQAGTEFVVATNQLERLAQLASEVQSTPEPWGKGVDAEATLGMNLIFESIPQKFPVEDLLNWLRDAIHPQNLPINARSTGYSSAIVEVALKQLVRLYG